MKKILSFILIIPLICGAYALGATNKNEVKMNLQSNSDGYSISKIKSPSVAGMFYPNDKESLLLQIEDFKKNSKNMYKVSTRAVIVPHAGLKYSGRLAYEGISQLDKRIKNIFIIAPAHRVPFEGLALSSYDEWNTPIGNISINKEINNDLINNFGAKINDTALAPEHSIEVELPFVQTEFDKIKIIPILVGNCNPEIIYKIFSKYYKDTENGFIISSDLSHYLSNDMAKRVDNYTAQHIETNTVKNFTPELACGAIGIMGLIDYASENNYSLIRVDMTNSSSTTFDNDRVVGYGVWFLYEGDRNSFIKENYSEFVIDLCKKSIKNKCFNLKKIIYPQVFNEYGAAFVTLEKYGQLRGCIGSIIPNRPLIEDIVLNAKNAAYSDPRFNPVEKNEIKDLKISVSLLSIPTPIDFKDEKDLLNKIRENQDGIIIRDGNFQAVYLPSVWEQLPNKIDFLNSLKVKAGMSPDHFSKTFEAYRFETSYIKEK